MDTAKYKLLFLKEAGEHIASIEAGLLSLESGEGSLKTIDDIFRGFHSIKGMSASMGYEAIAQVAHTLEDILGGYRGDKRVPHRKATAIFFKGVDCLKTMVREVSEERESTVDAEGFVSVVKGEHDAIIAAGREKVEEEEEEEETPQVTPQKLDLPKSIKVEGSLFDDLLVVVGELLSIRSGLLEYSTGSTEMEVKESIHGLGKNLERLYTMVLAARMLPVEDLTYNLPRMVRDLSRGANKEVELFISGKEIRLDKMVLEKMGDPLIHLIRNAIDHGIEPQEERLKQDKPPKGRLSISVRRRQENVVMEVRDDGRGIDIAGVRDKALEMGIPPDSVEKMSKKEMLLVTCLPGLSLAREVTDISGRGVGMDIVKEGVEAVGGSLEMDSTKGKGTVVRLFLPLSVSIIRVLTVYSGDEMFAIPIASVMHVIEIERGLLRKKSRPTVDLNGEPVPVNSLANLLGTTSPNGGRLSRVVLVTIKEERFGLEVDDTGDEMEAYIKPLSPPLTKVRGVSGVTILGNGRPVLLLDLPALLP